MKDNKCMELKLDFVSGMLWVVVANVSGGDWNKQSQDWQDAAARWRDNFHTVAHKYGMKVA